MKFLSNIVSLCYFICEIIFLIFIFILLRDYVLSKYIFLVFLLFLEMSVFLFVIFYILEKNLLNIVIKYEKRKLIMSPENFIYYREKIKEITPAEMQFMLKRKLDFNDAVLATLLSLEMKGYLKICDDKIVILDKDKSLLTNHEKSILSSMNALFVNKYFVNHLKVIVRQDCMDKGFIKKFKLDKVFSIFFFVIICAIIIMVMILVPDFDAVNKTIRYICLFDVLFPFLFVWVSFMFYSVNPKIKFYLTESGIEMCQKIYGLKRYFDDFLIIEDRAYKEVVFWEEYLLYAIIFNKKGSLNNEMKKKFDVIKEIVEKGNIIKE